VSRTAIVLSASPLVSSAIAIVALDEEAGLALLVGTVLIVAAGAALSAERVRPADFRAVGLVFALACATLYAVRDNIVRWGSERSDVTAFVGLAAALVTAVVLLAAYVAATRRGHAAHAMSNGLAGFAAGGIALGFAYVTLFEAFDRGRVTVISPLAATQSLWAVLLAALLMRTTDAINRRLVIAAVLVVVGGGLVAGAR
jgi:drug/metabolite transporter (DMT)-like permease